MKIISTLFAFLFISTQAFASDTSKITSHNKVIIKTDPSKGFTQYPAKVEFPSASTDYRKVYLYMEFGCAPGLKCGEWDYINNIFLRKDSVQYEIARFITPYGFYWNSGQNWKHGWYFDLTDFSYLLHDSVEIVYQHTGYEGNTDRGWTVTMDFYCVNGTPARIPMGIQTLHNVSAPYGDVNNPFSNVVTPKSFTMPDSSDAVNFKIIQTGHGMDQQENCSEFCSKVRTVGLDGNTISVKNVWRDDCGSNGLYPQAGTWIYDRAGWCPGAPVIPDDVYRFLNPGTTHSFSLDMQAYSNTTGGSANYSLSTYAMFFKDNRKQTDAAIEDIIAPSSHLDYLRQNPTCGAPIISVRNMGKDTIKKLEFLYGKQGGVLQTIWVPCNIAPFTNGKVTLEAIYNWRGAGNTFFVMINKVNDKVDEYMDDNTMYSTIQNSQVFPNKIIIVLKTNSAPTENSYTLKDAKGNVIRTKNNFAANTIYRDTVQLDNNICYTFELRDDGTPPGNNPLNKDGLDWWANPNDGNGYIQIRNGNNNSMLKNFNADFGTFQSINFTTTFSMDIPNTEFSGLQLDVLPNPGLSGEMKIFVEAQNTLPYSIYVYDYTGKTIQSFENINDSDGTTLSNLAPGIYTVTLLQGNSLVSRKIVVQ